MSKHCPNTSLSRFLSIMKINNKLFQTHPIKKFGFFKNITRSWTQHRVELEKVRYGRDQCLRIAWRSVQQY